VAPVLQPGGILVIWTPNYSTFGRRLTESLDGGLIPGGYHNEHIPHFSRESLTGTLTGRCFVREKTAR
jgi:hypothetical protein